MKIFTTGRYLLKSKCREYCLILPFVNLLLHRITRLTLSSANMQGYFQLVSHTLNGGSTIKAINTWAILVIWYTAVKGGKNNTYNFYKRFLGKWVKINQAMVLQLEHYKKKQKSWFWLFKSTLFKLMQIRPELKKISKLFIVQFMKGGRRYSRSYTRLVQEDLTNWL